LKRGGSPLAFRLARFGMTFAGVLLATAALAVTPRTVVVRGHAYAPDGVPLAGARVMARGTVSVNTFTDDNGRYTLSVPLGMPAGLRTAPFRLEVRAEASGRRLPLSGGGSSLVLDASWQAAAGRVRVQSNRQEAATAVATAIQVEDVTTAWIDADFGGAAKEAGGGHTFTQEAALPGSAPGAVAPRDTAPAGSAPVTPVAVAPRDTAPAKPAPAVVAAPAAPVAVAPRDTATAKPAPLAPVAVAARDTAPAKPAPPVAAAPTAPVAPVAAAARDTAPSAASTSAAAPESARVAGVAPPSANRPPAASRGPAVPAPRIIASSRTVPAEPPRNPRVRAMDPYARRDTVAPPDSCRCTLRGTVEIDWTRPLEESTPVRVELESPAASAADLVLYMGAPREFRFGPLPCGEWRLRVRPGGKLRLADATGDTVRVVHCAGLAEMRVVLTTVKR
jgi:hypothetical protein